MDKMMNMKSVQNVMHEVNYFQSIMLQQWFHKSMSSFVYAVILRMFYLLWILLLNMKSEIKQRRNTIML